MLPSRPGTNTTDSMFSPSSSEPQHKVIPFDFSSTDSRLLCDNFYTNGGGGNSSSGVPKMPPLPSIPAPLGLHHIPPPLGLEPPPPLLSGLQQPSPPSTVSLTAGVPTVGLQVPPPLGLHGPIVSEPGQAKLHHHYLQVTIVSKLWLPLKV